MYSSLLINYCWSCPYSFLRISGSISSMIFLLIPFPSFLYLTSWLKDALILSISTSFLLNSIALTSSTETSLSSLYSVSFLLLDILSSDINCFGDITLLAKNFVSVLYSSSCLSISEAKCILLRVFRESIVGF